MPEPAEHVVRRYTEALNARDLDAAFALWSPEAVHDMLAIGILRGPDEVREVFESVFAAMPDFEFTIERIAADGDSRAFVQWRGAGTHTGGELLGIEATGRWIDMRGCDLFEVDGGLIVRGIVYQDGMAIARAQGMLPAQGSGAERAMLAAFNAATRVRLALGARLSG